MEYFPRSFFGGLEERLTGPAKGRLIVQPLVAIALGIRDGIADAKQGLPPYFERVLFSKHKLNEVKAAFKHIAAALSFGIVMDLIFQWMVFQVLFLIPALMVGSLFVALPYILARGLTNRIARRWYYDRRAKRESDRE